MDMEQGVPNSFITAIIEDAKGDYWMGGNEGLIKYDGKNFLYYNMKPLVANATVSSLLEDRNGNFWLRLSNGEHFAIYDGHRLFIYRYADFFPGHFNRGIMEDSQGNIWFSNTNGLIKFENGNFILYATGLEPLDCYSQELMKDKDGVFLKEWNDV